MTATTLAPPQRPQVALADSPQPELRRLSATLINDCIVLDGRVSSFYLKQLAQETVKAGAAGRRVLNRISVDE